MGDPAKTNSCGDKFLTLAYKQNLHTQFIERTMLDAKSESGNLNSEFTPP